MKKRLRVIVSGIVQGVNFRWATMEEAERLKLYGWVKNLTDRKVEAVFEGEEQALLDILEFIKKGPSAARVTTVEETYSEFTDEFAVFSIKH